MGSLTRDCVNVLFMCLFVMDGMDASGDYMMTCSRPVMSKTPRLLKHDLGLPCDLSKESWCNLPGDKYPWHAVRSFVFENQGLMRRMYGEVRQLSVLRMEFNGNSIDDNNSVGREFDDTFKPVRGTAGFASTTPSPSTTTTTESTTPPPASTTTTSWSTTSTASTPKPDFAMPLVTQFVTVDSLTSAATPAPTQRKVEEGASGEGESGGGGLRNVHSSLDQMIKFMEDLNEQSGSAAVNSGEGLLPPTTTDSANVLLEDAAAAAADGVTTTMGIDDGDAGTTMFAAMTSATEEIPQPLLFQDAERTTLPRVKTTTENVKAEPMDSEDESGAGGAVVKDEQVERADVKGVNACPVKEEVVAPYWANNTRGEVLALLNLYPFEQYIHWEKCTFEHRQMYCRDGCRCEQQYRLHRLLAFDPTNECRGIFSDWFRFPSCCVCKCYLTSTDLAQERFSFNRSPRLVPEEASSRGLEHDFDVDVPDVNGVDDSHFYYKNSKLRQPRR